MRDKGKYLEMLNDNKLGKLYVWRRHVKLNNHSDARQNSQRNLRAENKEKEKQWVYESTLNMKIRITQQMKKDCLHWTKISKQISLISQPSKVITALQKWINSEFFNYLYNTIQHRNKKLIQNSNNNNNQDQHIFHFYVSFFRFYKCILLSCAITQRTKHLRLKFFTFSSFPTFS